MKHAGKFVLIFVVFDVLAVGAAALYIHLSGIPKYPVEKVDLKIEVTPARVEAGRKIVGMLCAGCHLDNATGRMAGKRMEDAPPQFGTAYSRNITQHETEGIGNWSDGDIATILRTGLTPSGQYTPPWMVKLPRASDEEIASIIAFLRSDDPLVAASDAVDRESEPTFFTKLLCRVAFKPFPYPKQPITAPPPSDKAAYGKHLAINLLDCYGCHSADFSTNDENQPEKSKDFFAGGNTMLDLAGKPIQASNITLDKETGIGRWTEDQFLRAVKGGFRPDNTPILYPMQPYVELTDDEVRAIYAYLKTVPPLEKAVPRSPRAVAAATDTEGKKIYFKYSCQSCHGETGSGLCELRQSHIKFATDETLIAFIKNPAATAPGAKMPAWDGVIEEAEYAPLAQYVRTLSVK